MKVLFLVLACAALASAQWSAPVLLSDVTNPSAPVCDITEAQAAIEGMPFQFNHCVDGNNQPIMTRTPCCNDENYAANGRQARDNFLAELDANRWMYAEENFESFKTDCFWAWPNVGRLREDPNTGNLVLAPDLDGCSNRDEIQTATSQYQNGQEVTRVTAWREEPTSGGFRPQRPILRIANAQQRVGINYDYSGLVDGNGVERDLFHNYVEVLGNEVEQSNTVFLNFSTPIQALSFYMRDISTDLDNTANNANSRLVTLNCVGGQSGETPIFPVGGIPLVGSAATASGSADITYFSARHRGPCDPTQACRNMKLTNILSEDAFGMDALLTGRPGSACADSSISGYVYSDNDQDGRRSTGDTPLVTCDGSSVQTVTIELCKERFGEFFDCRNTTTDSNGYYQFTGLVPNNQFNEGIIFAYRLREYPVECYTDGSESIGTFDPSGTLDLTEGPRTAGSTFANPPFGGEILNDEIGMIWIKFGGSAGTNFNFGELSQDPCIIAEDVGCYVAATEGNPLTRSTQQNRLGVALKFKAADDCACREIGASICGCSCYGDAACITAQAGCANP